MCILHLEVYVPLTLTKQAQRGKNAAQFVFSKLIHIHTLHTNQTSHTSGFLAIWDWTMQDTLVDFLASDGRQSCLFLHSLQKPAVSQDTHIMIPYNQA
jgi:hypothetical protein